MTKFTIKEKMIEMMSANIEAAITELVMDEIDDEAIYEFLWSKDYGQSIAEDYVLTNKEELIEQVLEEIYEDIDMEDFDAPWN